MLKLCARHVACVQRNHFTALKNEIRRLDLMILAAKTRGDAIMGMRCRVKRGEVMEEIRILLTDYKRAWGIVHD